MVSEEKLFNNIKILYMYTAQKLGKITLAEYNFDYNLKLLLHVRQPYIVSLKHFNYFCPCACVYCAQGSFSFIIDLCLNAGTYQAETHLH